MEATVAHAVEDAEDAGSIGWHGTWTLTPVVLALIAIAVGDELAIAHPDYDAYTGFTILTFGGPALVLLAQTMFLRKTSGYVAVSRLLGVVALGVLAVATKPFNLTVGIAAATSVLIAVAIADTVTRLEQPIKEHA